MGVSRPTGVRGISRNCGSGDDISRPERGWRCNSWIHFFKANKESLTWNDYERALVGMAKLQLERNGVALRSARVSTLKKYLTQSTLSETRCYNNYPGSLPTLIHSSATYGYGTGQLK